MYANWLLLILLALRLKLSMQAAPNPCRELLACSIQKRCIKLPWLVDKMQTTSISTEMYNHIDSAIDYGCIFASGCPRQCTACGLCHSAKLRLFELLAGGSKEGGVECPVLHGCAKECVKNSNNNLSSLNHCLRHVCAYHCFNGSCPKCSSFIFKIFNQMCVAGNLRTIVKYNGQCPDLFREVVHAKFKKEFEFDRRLRR